MKKVAVWCSLILCVLALHGCYTPPSGGGVSQRPFSLQVKVGKTMYKVSDKIIFSVQTTRNCYLTLYDISTEGEVTQIFPNQFATDNYIEGGYTYPIPDQKDSFDFEIVGPPGLERVRGVCTIEDVNLVEARKVDATETFPRILEDERGEFDKSLNSKLQVIPSERWAEASVTFQVIQ
jgi:hypothetical protein